MKKIILIIFLFFSLPVLATNDSVPFLTQAPLAQWEDQRQQDGCEEAAAIMAMAWVRGEKTIDKTQGRNLIIEISEFEQDKYGEYRDVYVDDLVDWVFKDWFKYDKVKVLKEVTLEQLKEELTKGNLILAPTNGQILKNPNFKAPGPERHMLIIKGYDDNQKKFITNDPGTRKGENYCYDENVLFTAINAYPTGYHQKIEKIEKSVIIVSK